MLMVLTTLSVLPLAVSASRGVSNPIAPTLGILFSNNGTTEDASDDYLQLVANPEFVAPKVKEGSTYDGKAKDLCDAGSITFTEEKPDDESFIEYAVSSDGTNAPETGWDKALPTKTNAGTYYVWYRWQGKLYTGVEPTCIGSVTIAPAEQTITGDTKKTLSFTATTGLNLGAKASGKLTYTVLEGTSVNVSATGALTINSVGITTIKIAAASTANYLAAEKTVTVEVTKGALTPTAEPAVIEELVYNGEEQRLITAGKTEIGTYMYSLDGKEWSEELPTAIAAGTYNVHYYISGGESYADTEPAELEVVIAKAAVTITADDHSTLVGAKLVALTYHVTSGKLFGNDAEGVKLSKTEGDQPGKYPITVTFDNANYEATLTAGTYAILRKDVRTQNEYGITVVSKAGQDSDSKLVVVLVEGEDILANEKVTIGTQDYRIDKVYEIHFDTNGVTTQPDGTIQVRMPIPEELRGEKTLKVVYLAEDGKVINMDAFRDGDDLVFVTDHLSQYAIVTPASGSMLWLIIVIIVVVLLAAAACVYFFVIRKKKNA